MFSHTIYFDSCLERFLQNAAIRLSKISRRARNKCKLELCAMLDQSCLRLFSYNNIFVKSAFLYGSKKSLYYLPWTQSTVTEVTKFKFCISQKTGNIYYMYVYIIIHTCMYRWIYLRIAYGYIYIHKACPSRPQQQQHTHNKYIQNNVKHARKLSSISSHAYLCQNEINWARFHSCLAT